MTGHNHDQETDFTAEGCSRGRRAVPERHDLDLFRVTTLGDVLRRVTEGFNASRAR